MGARADRRGPRPGLRRQRLRLRLLRVARGPTPTTGSAASPPGATSPTPGSEVVLLEGDDQAKLGGTVPAGHQGGAIHFGEDGKLYVAIGDQTAGEPAQRADDPPGQAPAAQPRRLDPRGQPVLSRRPGASTGRSGRWACATRSRFAVQPGTGRIFINDVGEDPLGGDRRGVRRRQLRLARWRKGRRPTRDSAGRSTTTRSPRSPAAPSARPGPRPGSRLGIAAGTSSWTSSRAGSRSSTPTIRSRWRRSPTGLTRPVDLAFAPDGQPLRPAPRRLGHRRELPPGHRLAAADPRRCRRAAATRRPRPSGSPR